MEEFHSKQSPCVAKDLVYSANKESESIVDAITSSEGILATRDTLNVYGKPGQRKEVISASFPEGVFSLTKTGSDAQLPVLSLEKQTKKGDMEAVGEDSPEYRSAKGALLQIDKMFKTLPKCEIDKD